MVRLRQICCASFKMELRNFNVNKTLNIPDRHFILTLYIVTFLILLLLLMILCNLFYSINNLMASLSVKK